jgi:hypothetical protein
VVVPVKDDVQVVEEPRRVEGTARRAVLNLENCVQMVAWVLVGSPVVVLA